MRCSRDVAVSSAGALRTTADLIRRVSTPMEICLPTDRSYQNAWRDASTPFISAVCRYNLNIRAVTRVGRRDRGSLTLDGRYSGRRERLGVATRAPPERRQQQQRSGRISFRYTPRPSIPPDGRWVLSTSNQETLRGWFGARSKRRSRQDVFPPGVLITNIRPRIPIARLPEDIVCHGSIS